MKKQKWNEINLMKLISLTWFVFAILFHYILPHFAAVRDLMWFKFISYLKSARSSQESHNSLLNFRDFYFEWEFE